MRFCIHRGAEEIGGNCIQVESQGKSVLLDLGAPLTDGWTVKNALPDVPGLIDDNNPNLLGIVISHPHADHYGLAVHAHPSIPINIGGEADKLLRAASAFGPFSANFVNVIHYKDRKPFSLGPFRITPYLNDHSAFDAYSFLIEADGKRLFYSGDLRGHGWKKWAFDKLLKDGPKGVDVMLLEGTTMGRNSNESIMSESDLVEPLTESMRETKGIVLAGFSGQNIDRLVTFYKAALKSGRTFVVDLYIAHLLHSLGRKSLPNPTNSALRVYLPKRMKMKIVRDKTFDLVEPYKRRRIYPSELTRRKDNIVMTFRASMAQDLEAANCLKDGRLIYSMWPGYLERGSFDLRDWCGQHGVNFEISHTSGHAHPNDLSRLVHSLNPTCTVPIHTHSPDKYSGFDSDVVAIANKQWVSI
ncbi:MAG: MBL fold metallo-hydrolase [Rhodospirillales bacterium]|jgi:ribonuclease J|nr:MBL fold metallo-hydrolase [Rhodospirillales bacterium]MBT4626613.1 MBL fold metallo-hydrolase [Rhodospirillales bacterium]MBT6825143.1 MBL fold metallo-hydrolase [Rhodospirillales bacterium]